MQLLSPELVKFSSLKNSPISSNHRNFHQNWWQKKHKIWWNYCHQNWWHFRHSKTHQFLQFTKNVTKIGEKVGENSIENSNHQNFHQNWWKFWWKFNRKWMWAPTSQKGNKCNDKGFFLCLFIYLFVSTWMFLFSQDINCLLGIIKIPHTWVVASFLENKSVHQKFYVYFHAEQKNGFQL